MRIKRGFTYIELTITAAIIAVLGAIAVPNFLEARVRAAVSRSKADLASLKMAIEDYRADHRIYPLNGQKGVAGMWDLNAVTTPVAYISTLPLDTFTMRANQSNLVAPYQYYNAEQVNSEQGLKVLSPQNQFSGYVGALAWGIGPSQSIFRQPPLTATTITASGEATLQSYDPTNGTTSRGEIYCRLP